MATGPYNESLHEREKTAQVVASGSLVEAIGGLAAVILAILGLIGTLPMTMLTIGGMCVGFALLVEGAAIASRWSRLQRYGGNRYEATLGSGVTAEFLAGIVAFVLSLMALMGYAPATLMPVTLICLGAGILLGSGQTAEMTRLSEPQHRMMGFRRTDESTTEVNVRTGEDYRTPAERRNEDRGTDYYDYHNMDRSIAAASGAQLFVGLGVITLGVLSLIGYNPMTLCLVGVLAVGVAILLSGGVIASRLWSVFSR